MCQEERTCKPWVHVLLNSIAHHSRFTYLLSLDQQPMHGMVMIASDLPQACLQVLGQV
jgi:hypothetical protein